MDANRVPGARLRACGWAQHARQSVAMDDTLTRLAFRVQGGDVEAARALLVEARDRQHAAGFERAAKALAGGAAVLALLEESVDPAERARARELLPPPAEAAGMFTPAAVDLEADRSCRSFGARDGRALDDRRPSRRAALWHRSPLPRRSARGTMAPRAPRVRRSRRGAVGGAACDRDARSGEEGAHRCAREGLLRDVRRSRGHAGADRARQRDAGSATAALGEARPGSSGPRRRRFALRAARRRDRRASSR